MIKSYRKNNFFYFLISPVPSSVRSANTGVRSCAAQSERGTGHRGGGGQHRAGSRLLCTARVQQDQAFNSFGRSDPCLLRISFDLVLISVGQFASLVYDDCMQRIVTRQPIM